MKTPQVKTGFNGYSDPKLNLAGKTIIEMMTNNPHFVSPTPGLNEVHNAWSDYSASLALAQSGDRALIAAKNTKKQALADILFRLTTYVNLAAAGNTAALLSSGMEFAKSGTPSVLTKPVIRVANGTNPGTMNVYVDEVSGAKSFMYQYTFDPVNDASIWVSEGSSIRTLTFTGFEAGRKIWFRVVAVGAKKQQIVSEVVAGMSL